MRRDSEEVFEPRSRPWEIPWEPEWSAEQVIFALEPFVGDDRVRRIRSVVEQRLGNVVVVLDAPHDPHNGAAIIRTSEAFGLTEVHVVPREEPFLASRRVTCGTENWIDIVSHASPEEAVSSLHARGFEAIATHPEGELLPTDLAALPKLALVLGNEHAGISEPLARACRRSVRVPMRGFVESLNVGVTAAILLSFATLGRPGDLSAAERRALYARGLWRSIPRAREVLEARVQPQPLGR
jgi:tRNA (guanosine-2'-O-)-methyltransferase